MAKPDVPGKPVEQPRVIKPKKKDILQEATISGDLAAVAIEQGDTERAAYWKDHKEKKLKDAEKAED